MVRPTVPGYEILEELGRGGMGVVYKARQAKLNRLVALKMILSGPFAAKDDRQRFFMEAELLAKLRHPNIIQIHDFGESQGIPYFSLEFAEGGTLHRWLHGKKVTAEEAAAMVLSLAQAMESAHAQGIVHRDLKPANILLQRKTTASEAPTREGGLLAELTLKITDFGLAKWQATNLTATGAVLGTPNYMAPEQARGSPGQVTAAADVYGLGAILYEVLTNRPPFVGATPYDVIDQVLLKDPTPPRSLRPEIPRDLETICQTAMAKEPLRRYASAALLAEDLRRFLAGEPILARHIGRVERAWLWCRRNPVLATLAGLLLVGVLALSILTGLLVRNLGKLSDTLRDVEQQRRRADTNLSDADAVLRDLSQLVSQIRETHPSFVHLKKVLLEKAIGYYAVFIRGNADRPELARQVVKAYLAKAALHKQLSQYEECLKASDAALKLAEELRASDPASNDSALAVVEARTALAEACSSLGRRREASEQRRHILELLEPLRQAGKLPPQGWGNLGKCLNAVANDEMLRGDHSASLATLEQAKTCLETAIRLDPTEPKHRRILAGILHDLGVNHRFAGDTTKSEQALRDAIAMTRKVFAAEAESGDADLQALLAGHFIELASTLTDANKIAEAEAAYLEGIAVAEKLCQAHPLVAAYWQRLGFLHTNRANLLMDEDRHAEALAALQAAKKANATSLELAAGDINTRNALAINRTQTGILLYADRLWPQALAEFQEAHQLHAELMRQLPGNWYVEEFVNDDETWLARCHRRLGRPDEGLKLVEGVLRRREKRLTMLKANPERFRMYLGSLQEQGRCLAELGEPAKAVECQRRVRQELAKMPQATADDKYHEGCTICLELALTPKLKGLEGTAAREAAEADLSREAAEKFQAALQAGFKKTEMFFTDDDLAAWRSRPEFSDFVKRNRLVAPAAKAPVKQP